MNNRVFNPYYPNNRGSVLLQTYLLTWGCILVLSLVFYRVYPQPPGLLAYGIVLGSIFAFSLGALLAGFSKMDESTVSYSNQSASFRSLPALVCFAMSGLVIFVMLLDFKIYGSAGLTLGEIRHLHVGHGFQRQGAFSYIRAFTMPMVSVLIVQAIAGRIPFGCRILVLFVIIFGVFSEAFTTGGRTLLKLSLFLFVSSLVVYHSAWLRVNYKKTLVAAALGSFFLLFAFSWFNLVRGASRGIDYAVDYRQERGREVLEAAGIGFLPDFLLVPIVFVYGYMVAPLGNLQHFLMNDNIPLRWGLFNFSFVGRRFDYYWMFDKLAIDSYYADLGIYNNVWATAYRELHVDFDYIGIVLLSFFGGYLCIICQRLRGQRFVYGYVGVVLFCLFLFSPFESLMKDPKFEYCFYYIPVFAGLSLFGVNLRKWFGV